MNKIKLLLLEVLILSLLTLDAVSMMIISRPLLTLVPHSPFRVPPVVSLCYVKPLSDVLL